MSYITYNRIDDLLQNLDRKKHANDIIVRQESENNHYFHITQDKLESIINNNVDKCYHEVLVLNKKVKIFMDIDDTNSKSLYDHEKYISIIKNEFCAYFNSKCKFLANVNTLRSSDFINVTSHKKDNTKFSTNLVVKGYYFEDIIALRNFMLKFKNKLEINNKTLIPLIDFGVYSKNHNIRLPGSSKIGENRPKVSDHKFEESLLTNVNTKESILLTYGLNEDTSDEYHDDVEFADQGVLLKRLLELEKIREIISTNKTYTFGEIKNRTIFMIRNAPDYCSSCNRVHDRDPCIYLTISLSGNVYIKCRKSQETGGEYLGRISMESLLDDNNYDPTLSPRKKSDESLFDEELEQEEEDDTGEHAVGSSDFKNLPERDFRELLNAEKSPKMKSMMRDVYYNKTLAGPNFSRVLKPEHIEYYNSPEIKTFEPFAGGINLEKAEMKMGKTKKCHELIYNSPYSDELKCVVFISFRRTFSEDIKSKFTNFSLYREIKNTINLVEHPRLIIQTESLWRINENTIDNVDLVILDELESIWSQFGSGFFSNINGSLCNFEMLLKKSKYVFGFDANIGLRSVELLNKIVPDKQVKLRINSYKISNEDTYYLCPSINNFLNQLNEDIDDNKNIGIFTNSYSDAHALKGYIKYNYPFKNVKLYHGKMEEKIKTQHFGNVNKYWKNYDIIIATPVVTAGVSFEEEHFDCVYGLFTNQSCGVNICRQMLGRIRNVSEKKYYIHIVDFAQSFPTDPNVIENYLLYDRSYFAKLIESDGGIKTLQINLDAEGNIQSYNKNTLYWIVVANIRDENLSKNQFYKVFLDALGYSGVIKELCLNNADPSLKELYKDIKSKNKTNEYRKIAEAKDINDNEAQCIRQKIDAQISVLKNELLSLTRHNIKRRYKWNGVIDTDFVSIYGDKTIQTQYANIDEIMSDSEPSEACRENLVKDLNKYKRHINDADVPYKEIILKYKSFNHYIIHELLSGLNPNFNIQDAFLGSKLHLSKCEANFRNFETAHKLDWKFLMNKYGLSIFHVPLTFKEKLTHISSIIKKYYGFKVVLNKKSSMITLLPNTNFNYVDQNGENLLENIPISDKKPTIKVIF